MSEKEQDSAVSGPGDVSPERVRSPGAENSAATIARVLGNQFPIGAALNAMSKARREGMLAGIGVLMAEQRGLHEAIRASSTLGGVVGLSKMVGTLLGGTTSVTDRLTSSNLRLILGAASLLRQTESPFLTDKALSTLLGGAFTADSFKDFQNFIRPTIQRVRGEGDSEPSQGLADAVIRIANSPEFKQMVGPSVVQGHMASSLIVSDHFEIEVDSPLQPAEAEVVSSIANGWDVAGLSEQASQLWRVLWLVVSLFFAYLAAQNGAREELCFLQGQFAPGMTAGQWGKTIRAKLCETPLEYLETFRFIDGTGVRLRAEPSRKAEILPESLSHGQRVEVLDSSDKSWLRVRLIGQDVDGWVYRRYTHKLTK